MLVRKYSHPPVIVLEFSKKKIITARCVTANEQMLSIAEENSRKEANGSTWT